MQKNHITDEYILGTLQSKGTFTFSTNWGKHIPTFTIQFGKNDKHIAYSIKEKLSLKEPIYTIRKRGDDLSSYSYRLTVRSFGSLKNSIIPFCYNRFHDNQRSTFNHWINTIQIDPLVPKDYKILSRLHTSGYWN